MEGARSNSLPLGTKVMQKLVLPVFFTLAIGLSLGVAGSLNAEAG